MTDSFSQRLRIRNRITNNRPTGAVLFAGQVVASVIQNGGDYRRIYPFWQDNLERFDESFLTAIPVVFDQFIDAIPAVSKTGSIQEHAESITATFVKLGDLIFSVSSR